MGDAPAVRHTFDSADMHGRGAYGLMQLEQNPSKNTLGRAASLTGLSEKEIKTGRSANVEGRATVLSDLAGPDGPPRHQRLVRDHLQVR